MNSSDEWGTSTLALAAAVMSMGAQYVRADRTDTRRIVFFFVSPKDNTGMDKVVGKPLKFDFESVERSWANGDVRGDLKKYFQALNDLKSIIYSK